MRMRRRVVAVRELQSNVTSKDMLPGDLLNLVFGGTLKRWPRPVRGVLEVVAIGAAMAWLTSHGSLGTERPTDTLVSLLALLFVAVSIPFAGVSVAWFRARGRHLLPNDVILLVDGLAVAVGVALGSGAIRLG